MQILFIPTGQIQILKKVFKYFQIQMYLTLCLLRALFCLEHIIYVLTQCLNLL